MMHRRFSAIIAAKGAIEADDEDASYAIAAMLALGAVRLVAFPLMGHALGMNDQAYGLWAGLAVDNTAEATTAGALYSDAAGRFAVLAKAARNATIGFVVLGYALCWWSGDGDFGAGDVTRTRDLLITNQLLYQLSYAGQAGITILARR
jgi:uncharacterized membrane protein YadS